MNWKCAEAAAGFAKGRLGTGVVAWVALWLVGGAAAWGDEVFSSERARFVVSAAQGNVLSAAAGVPVLDACHDIYQWLADDGDVTSTEAEDVVVAARRDGERLVLDCRNPRLDLRITKTYELVAGGQALAKTIEVAPFERRGELRVRSVAQLVESYRVGASYYTPRQSWTAPAERDLFGVQPAEKFTEEVVSGSGWDNRFVVAQRPGSPALGHFRWAVRGRHVMPSAVLGSWGQHSTAALTYSPTGWSFQVFHTLEGERQPVSATVWYLLVPGDFLSVWREYRAQPEHRAWEEETLPEWAARSALGGFWHVSPPDDPSQIEATHAAAARLGDRYLPMGVFAWSLDGDYETDRPFVNETGTLIVTPEYFRSRVQAFQSDRRVRLGLYFQGGLIEARSAAYRDHPEWAVIGPDGGPVDSGFRDNPAGAMYWFHPLEEAWVRHYQERLRAVSEAYQPGWIYCDGGAALEVSDHRLRRPILADTWDRFYAEQREIVHATGPERAVLLNAQSWPHADLYWLECGYFNADQPWRWAVDFCFDTKVLHTPQRTMLPLYWSNDDKYLALCVAFGYTPCTSGRVGGWDERVWRAIDCAYAMRRAELILDSAVVSPVWWRDGGDVVCFAERVGGAVVVPVWRFSPAERTVVTVNVLAAGLPERVPAWIVDPFDAANDQDLGELTAADGTLRFELSLPPGFGGLRLIVLGEKMGWPG